MGRIRIETDGIYNYGDGEYYLSFQNDTRNWRAKHDKHLEDAKVEIEDKLEKAKKAIQEDIKTAKTEIKSDIASAKTSINNNVDQVETKVDAIDNKVGDAYDSTSSNTLFGKINRLLDRWI